MVHSVYILEKEYQNRCHFITVGLQRLSGCCQQVELVRDTRQQRGRSFVGHIVIAFITIFFNPIFGLIAFVLAGAYAVIWNFYFIKPARISEELVWCYEHNNGERYFMRPQLLFVNRCGCHTKTCASEKMNTRYRTIFHASSTSVFVLPPPTGR